MASVEEQVEILSARGMAWLRSRANPVAILGALMVASVVLCALFAPPIAPFPDDAGAAIDLRAKHTPPNGTDLLGTEKAQ